MEKFIQNCLLRGIESNQSSFQYVSKNVFSKILCKFLFEKTDTFDKHWTSSISSTNYLSKSCFSFHFWISWINGSILSLALIAKFCGDCVIQNSVWKRIFKGALFPNAVCCSWCIFRLLLWELTKASNASFFRAEGQLKAPSVSNACRGGCCRQTGPKLELQPWSYFFSCRIF